jgi:hypothetical protein
VSAGCLDAEEGRPDVEGMMQQQALAANQHDGGPDANMLWSDDSDSNPGRGPSAGDDLERSPHSDNQQDEEVLGMHSEGHEEVDEVVPEGLEEEPLVPIHFQPVLSDLTADWPGRCKLTQWLGHGAQFNGGWCMCNMLGKSSVVRHVFNQCFYSLNSAKPRSLHQRLQFSVSRTLCFVPPNWP